MKDEHKTKEQLIDELVEMRQRVAELEASETERRRAEEALRESERRYRLLAEHATDVIWTMDMDLRFTYLSPSVTDMLGYSVEEAMAQTLEEVLTPASFEVARKALAEALAVAEPKNQLELELNRKDGSTVWTEVKIAFLRDPDGRPVGILGVARDITERKEAEEALRRAHDELEIRVQERTAELVKANEALKAEITERKRAEEALRESEARYRLLVETANDAIYTLDSDLRVTDVNPFAEQAIGYSRDELIGRSFPELGILVPESLGPAAGDTARILAGERISGAVYEFITKDGQHLFGELSGAPIYQEGQVIGVLAIARDITERKRAEEEIKAKSQFLESLIEQSPLPTFVIDSEGICVMVNKAFLKVYNVPKREMVLGGNALTEPANVRQGVVKYIKEALSGKIVETPEIEFISPYENKRTVTKSRLFPIFDATNKLTNVVVIHEDVTERKRAEEALRESEERYRTLVEDIHKQIQIWEVDANGVYTYISPSTRWVYGFEPEEVIGKTPFDFMPPGEAGRVAEVFAKIAKSKEPFYDLENFAQHKDGHQLIMETSGSPFFSDDGTLLGYRGTAHDITERKRAEEKLKESEQRLKIKLDRILSPDKEIGDFKLTDIIDVEILQQIQDVFAQANGVASIILDLDANPITEESNYCELCRLIRQTAKGKASCRKSGVVLGEKVVETMEPAWHACLSCGLLEACAPIVVAGRHVASWFIGQCNTLDVSRERIRDYAEEIGADVDAMLAAFDKMPDVPMEKFKQILSLLWQVALELSASAYNNLKLAREVNMRKQAEGALKEYSERLEEMVEERTRELQDAQARLIQSEKLAATGRLAASVAHEINNPLQGISNYLSLISQQVSEEDPVRENLGMVKLGFERITEIVRRLRAFHRPVEEGMEPTDVNGVVERALALVGHQLSLGKVEVKRELVEHELPVLGSAGQLEQVLVNLVLNAQEAMPQGGELVVRTTLRDNVVQLQVSDTGRGISEEEMDRLFKPFYSGRGGKGLGLGLWISHNIIEGHGGRIEVESKVGEGTIFTISLPAYQGTGTLI